MAENKDKDPLAELLTNGEDIKIPFWGEQTGLSPKEQDRIEADYNKVSFTQYPENFKDKLGGAGADWNTLMDELGTATLEMYNGTKGIDKNPDQIALDLFDPLKFKNTYAPADTSAGASYIFFTGPQCNLRGTGHGGFSDPGKKDTFEGGTTNLHALPELDFFLHSEKHRPIMEAIADQLDVRRQDSCKMLPLLTNFAEDFNGLQDLNIEWFDTNGTIDDRKQSFIKGMEGSYGGGGTFNVNYFEASRYYVTLMNLIWSVYGASAAKGVVYPVQIKSFLNEIDYMGSAYFVRTGANMVDIDFIAKFVGVAPEMHPRAMMDGLQGGGLVKPAISYKFQHVITNEWKICANFNRDAGGNDIGDASIWGGVDRGDGKMTLAYTGESIYNRLSKRPYISDKGQLLWING